jgi:predicted 3-demethylubiquinone-9 3-methyltransferase (glyoxalase superfamily)
MRPQRKGELTMQNIVPFLWFEREAEEAAEFYVSIFPNSRITRTTHYSKGGQEIHGRRPGSVMTVHFELNGQEYIALNGGPGHAFNDSISLVVPCDSQEEIDCYWEKLTEGGRPIQCGWLEDRYGLSWQIVPREMDDLLADADSPQTERVMEALMAMVKLDIAELKRARSG